MNFLEPTQEEIAVEFAAVAAGCTEAGCRERLDSLAAEYERGIVLRRMDRHTGRPTPQMPVYGDFSMLAERVGEREAERRVVVQARHRRNMAVGNAAIGVAEDAGLLR